MRSPPSLWGGGKFLLHPFGVKEVLYARLGGEKGAAFHAARLGLFDPKASHAQCPLYGASTRRRLGFDGADCAARSAVSGVAPRATGLALGKSSRRAWTSSVAHRLSLHAWHASWQQGQTGGWCEGARILASSRASYSHALSMRVGGGVCKDASAPAVPGGRWSGLHARVGEGRAPTHSPFGGLPPFQRVV